MMNRVAKIFKFLFLFFLFLNFGCTKKNYNADFRLVTLSPGSVEFKTDLGKNRIDYYFLEGEFRYENENYHRLQNRVSAKIGSSRKTAYQFHSIYIYKKTTELNSKYTFGKEGLDGHNKDLIAYIRYRNKKPDLFYLIKDGVVVFDLLAQEKTDFDFDE